MTKVVVRGDTPVDGPLLVPALIESWREEREGFNGARDGHFRASGAGLWCPRGYALAAVRAAADRKPLVRTLDHEDLWLMDQGTALHDVFQAKALRSLKGVARSFEVDGFDPDYRMSGRWDAELQWDGSREILEIKTIMEDHATSMDPRYGGVPKPDHVLQLQCYLWLAKAERGRILYLVRGSRSLRHGAFEHVVYADGTVHAKLRETLSACHAAVAAVWAAKDAGADEAAWPVPDRLGECRKRSDPRAKRCPMLDLCLPPRAKRGAAETA